MSQSNCGPNSTGQFQSVQPPPPFVRFKGAHLPLMPPPSSSEPCLPINKTIPVATNVELEPSKQLPKSEARAVKRAKNKQYEAKVEDRLLKGLKPHVVEVTPRGKIDDGACEGKNAWDDLMRSVAPHTLDVFIVHVRDQDSAIHGSTSSLNE